ncbi:hemolysin family protein [uncultured Faecalibaculum sp.]|uniref:hemolysin family protein n=1 Tax=uncultured Faecalibaculum sp. TaxID=1729681 RepID=UPI002631F230|nr:transporter associated domain-containing protein [uncultured Faecalibaculum sp.]
MDLYPCIIIALLLTAGIIQFTMPHLEGRPRAALRLIQTACLVSMTWLLTAFCRLQQYPLWICVVAAVFLVYVFYFTGLFLPAFLASRAPEVSGKWAAALASLGRILAVFTFFTTLPTPENEEVSEDQIRELLAEADEEDIDEPQKELLENVFELDDTSVDEICTHRSQVVSLNMADRAGNWKKVIHDNRHTFYPIIGRNNEDVIGILDTRDYFRLEKADLENVITKCVDKPLFVAENMKADDLFRQMQKEKTYFAVVLDEYGGMTGIVTLHDIMETLFGRMQEADEAALPDDIRQLSSDSWEIMGSASLEDVADTLQIRLPVEEYDTFGGYVLGTYGFIPEDGTQLEIFLDPLAVQVFDIRHHRIGRTVVRRQPGQRSEHKEPGHREKEG